MNVSLLYISALTQWAKNLFAFQPDSPLMMGSIPFALLFIVFLAVYTLLRHFSRTAMMAYVVAFSLFFAYKVNGTVMWMLPLTAVLNYALTQEMRLREGIRRKALLTSVVVIDLALLCYFKYTNFIIGDVVNEMFGSNFSLKSIALPVGISFYTFQAISYAVDTYRRKFDMGVTLLEYCFYLTFFPLLMAGPITRAGNLIPRLKRNQQASGRMVWAGLFLVMLGLVKKNMLSDYIAQFNNWVFDAPQTFSGFENVAALLGYPVQIFLDFSGYSDMSIGVAAILGFYLPDNFYFPYRSLSVTEFWRRWHISLSFWFRDYVYIPLGGNRKGTVRMYLNNFITMLVAGLWHGASWMFVIWGALHGFGLVVHKFFSRQLGLSFPNGKAGNFLSWLLTYAYVCFAWSFFRAKDLSTLGNMFSKVAGDFSIDYLVPFLYARPVWMCCVVGVMLSYLFTERMYRRMQARFILLPWIVKLILFIVCLQLVVEFSQESVQPFIYCQF
jgi:alginate O-acetyltransferase complex protein AlgI